MLKLYLNTSHTMVLKRKCPDISQRVGTQGNSHWHTGNSVQALFNIIKSSAASCAIKQSCNNTVFQTWFGIQTSEQ